MNKPINEKKTKPAPENTPLRPYGINGSQFAVSTFVPPTKHIKPTNNKLTMVFFF